MADPAAVGSADVFRDAFRALENRIRIFTALPVASVDRMSRARRVEAIGRARPDENKDRAS